MLGNGTVAVKGTRLPASQTRASTPQSTKHRSDTLTGSSWHTLTAVSEELGSEPRGSSAYLRGPGDARGRAILRALQEPAGARPAC